MFPNPLWVISKAKPGCIWNFTENMQCMWINNIDTQFFALQYIKPWSQLLFLYYGLFSCNFSAFYSFWIGTVFVPVKGRKRAIHHGMKSKVAFYIGTTTERSRFSLFLPCELALSRWISLFRTQPNLSKTPIFFFLQHASRPTKFKLHNLRESLEEKWIENKFCQEK